MGHNQDRQDCCLKNVQLKGGKGSKTNAEIRNHIDLEGLDVLLLQEPYTIRKKTTSFGQATRVLTGNKRRETPWAAIMVFNSKLTIMRVDQLSDEHVATVLIEKGELSIYLVSAYLKFSHEIQPYLKRIEEILRTLKSKKVIIGMDANAKSPLWHAGSLNARGKLMEDFIAQGNL